jgi:hypothetical protein
MTLDPQTQGDARTKKHTDVCNGYLPTEMASEEERKMGYAECCDCWCHFGFTNPDGSDRDEGLYGLPTKAVAPSPSPRA